MVLAPLDRGLVSNCLAPGKVVDVKFDRSGALPFTLLEAPKAASPAPAEYDRLSVADAIEQIDDETDPKKLEALLKTEKRKTVIGALERRLQEVKAGGTQ